MCKYFIACVAILNGILQSYIKRWSISRHWLIKNVLSTSRHNFRPTNKIPHNIAISFEQTTRKVTKLLQPLIQNEKTIMKSHYFPDVYYFKSVTFAFEATLHMMTILSAN